MYRNFILFFLVLFSVACNSSEIELEERQEIDNKHKLVLELTKSENFEEAITVANSGVESIKSSSFSMIDQLRYLARFSNELAVLRAHLKRFDEALNDIDTAIGASKELVHVDDIFYFDVFEFSEQKAEIIKLYKGQQKESLYRFSLLSEISYALENSDEKLLVRHFEHQISKLLGNCVDNEMQFCESDLVDHCKWMDEYYKRYLTLNLNCKFSNNLEENN